MDKLQELAREAIELDEIKKLLKKEGVSITKANIWLPVYILVTVYSKESIQSMSNRFGVSRNTIYKYAYKEGVIKVIKDLKSKLFSQYEQKLYTYLDTSLNTVLDIMENGDTDSVRLKASELVLKKFNIISDKQNVELSGSVEVPIINIVTKKE